MRIPFFKQESVWTCGPASMRMLLAACGVVKTEKELVKLLAANSKKGTWHRKFEDLADKMKFNFISERESSLNRIKELLKEGYGVIVCYYIPREDEDHFSVVEKIDDEYVYFLDPWYGEGHKYKHAYFLRNWKTNGRWEDERKWLFAMKLKKTK